ncbi:hypothetical protein SD70_28775 [Gordoniibacillus kamchatkensis]|uniref:Luciferase-like domain-containing protein n=1 Tax=Gordoniibacillus kamchatkensis TaxID=1590651 RepID=A0ABR5AB03_9BACL|nr:hypothetical protein SD70_28775 [Paenibacillus sp. VKM B-2647]
MRFSLLYFSSKALAVTKDNYRLVLDGAQFADERGFEAVWLPERHFHAFGGLFPNPSVLSAALAVKTNRLRIRAGSVVLPLHHTARVAEEWAMVDQLSGGRVDLAFAAGWNANDFVFSPESYTERNRLLYEGIGRIRELWRGEPYAGLNGNGELLRTRLYPAPVQKELEVWVTCTKNEHNFIQAGAIGANVLTGLLFQTVEELEAKIKLYRDSLAANGYDRSRGKVTLMLHTFVGKDPAAVRRKVQEPFKAYLRDSVDLWKHASSALGKLSQREQDRVLDFAFERYYRTSALFGDIGQCLKIAEQIRSIGIDEIACLIDFGVDTHDVMTGLEHLDELRNEFA